MNIRHHLVGRKTGIMIFLALSWILLNTTGNQAQEIKPDLFKQLKYRHIGPIGNRVSAVVGVPGDRNICYAGTASGGIFKSIDGGINWKPIFDKQKALSIGALALAPSDPNIIWAGTGEAHIRSNVSQGDGVYKSYDGGKTWKNMGLPNSGRISRIVIDPRDPDIVFAGALGHCYGPQPDRGVYRTTDGGQNWEKVLFVDEDTGCSDIIMDPKNPRTLLAGMWPFFIRTWGRWSGGPGGGLHISHDGGTTWKKIKGKGLPETEIGKVALAIAPSNPERIYAMIEAKDEGLWRSDNGGASWTHINHDHVLLNRPHYYTRCVVAPDDHNEVYFPATRFYMTLDGGENLRRFNPAGGDHHDIWIDPQDPERMIVGNDQGVSISTNRGRSWHGVQLPIAQMYHVYVDNRIPYYVYGNRQDGSSYMGPSNSRLGRGGIPRGLWHPCGGFESGVAVPDPVDNNIVWSGNYDGMLDRFDRKNKQSRAVSIWPEGIQGWPAAEVKYRFQWTFPIMISPHDHNRVYVGSQHVHQTTNGGHSWTVISPDLSTNDKSKQQSFDGISRDDVSPYYCCVIFALAESPMEEGVIWAGTNDGLLQITRNGGGSWLNVTKNIPDLPKWGTVSNIEPSRFDAGTCYVTYDLHQVNNRDPFVFKTTDYGKSWQNISSDIPRSVLSYAHCVREDPLRRGMLYLGTENAIYVSFNDGKNWLPLQTNLPHAPAHWLVVQEHFNDLVVSTYGRGFWILDDITPLQQMTSDVVKTEAHLFSPRPAYRFRNIAGPSGQNNDPSAGQNPTYGASLNYYLKAASKEVIKVVIQDESGQTVRTLKMEKPEDSDSRTGRSARPFKIPKSAGINRLFWDLRYERTKQVKLWAPPTGHDHLLPSKKGWRSLSRGRPGGVLAPPGTYTVILQVGDKKYSQKLAVIKDPHSTGTAADIKAQTKVLLELNKDINTVAAIVNRIELIRKQIHDLNVLFKDKKEAEAVVKAAQEMDKKIIKIEDFFFATGLTGSGDGLRWPDRFYARLGSLSRSIGSSDFPPTTQQLAVYEMFKQQLAQQKELFENLLQQDLSEFNQMLKAEDMPVIYSKF